MNNRFVINFVPGNTMMHKLTGGTKVSLFILFTIAVISTFDIRLILPLMCFPVAAIISMKPNYKPLIAMFTFMFLTVGVFGTAIMFVVAPNAGMTHVGCETIIWRLNDSIYLSKEFLWYNGVFFLKRVVSFTIVVAFALATTPSEFASGLAFLKVPYKVCIIVSLAYRTIPDVARQFLDIRNSMQMRGVELSSKGSLIKRIQQHALLLAPLIISTFSKVGNISKAMDLRGFGKEKNRTWFAEHELTKADRVLRVGCIVLIILILVYILYSRVINPYPAQMWCPFVSVDQIQQVNVVETLLIWNLFN